MNPRTELAITGLGVALLMLLVFLAPAPAMAQIASCTTDASSPPSKGRSTYEGRMALTLSRACPRLDPMPN
jgi:hypothetical protein